MTTRLKPLILVNVETEYLFFSIRFLAGDILTEMLPTGKKNPGILRPPVDPGQSVILHVDPGKDPLAIVDSVGPAFQRLCDILESSGETIL